MIGLPGTPPRLLACFARGRYELELFSPGDLPRRLGGTKECNVCRKYLDHFHEEVTVSAGDTATISVPIAAADVGRQAAWEFSGGHIEFAVEFEPTGALPGARPVAVLDKRQCSEHSGTWCPTQTGALKLNLGNAHSMLWGKTISYRVLLQPLDEPHETAAKAKAKAKAKAAKKAARVVDDAWC